jgi:hypothetical protein
MRGRVSAKAGLFDGLAYVASRKETELAAVSSLAAPVVERGLQSDSFLKLP